MLNHISIGVRSIATSKRFYDAAFGALGYRCLSQSDSSLGYGASQALFWLLQSEHPVTADLKSGLHFCIDAPDVASVKAFHARGLQNGGHDHGKPAVREEYSADYYAAFLTDPDGYRIEAYCSAQS
jgi:catechol 2,3-dioxygenase-like lactoylglutathione lyase family enzyme